MVDASTANTPIPGGWDRRNTIPGIEEIIRILVVLLEIESQNASTNSQDISLVRYHKSACLHIYYNKTSHDNDVPQGLLLLPLHWLCSV